MSYKNLLTIFSKSYIIGAYKNRRKREMAKSIVRSFDMDQNGASSMQRSFSRLSVVDILKGIVVLPSFVISVVSVLVLKAGYSTRRGFAI